MINKEIIAKLRDYADLEGSELGESINILIALLNYEPYLSNYVIRAIEAELIYQYEWFEENTAIVEHTNTITNHYYELEYI